jgi:acyl dehydratase
MVIPTSALGVTAGPREQAIDARWLMAYAAALGEHAQAYFDTTRPGGILAHPLFPVCYEWPLALDVRARVLADEAAVRGVHATHHLTLHRPPRPGDRLRTTATVAALERRAPGAYMVVRLHTVDAAGEPVSTTDYGSLYLGVECEAGPPPANDPHPGSLPRREREKGEWWSAEVPVSATLAHVYTECARIWNPIHTDRAVALGAGLPDIILHGTATLALAVSEALRQQERGPATRVRAIACRFGTMVRLPSRLVVRGRRPEASADRRVVRFEALAEDGRPAVRDGTIDLEPTS